MSSHILTAAEIICLAWPDAAHTTVEQVILDGVFNHTGRKFFAFKDIMEKGDKWETSQYKDWYFIEKGNSTYGDAFAYRSVIFLDPNPLLAFLGHSS